MNDSRSRKIDNAAEALMARFRTAPWFVSSSVDDDTARIRLLVRDECPFREHREVLGFGVRVVVAETHPEVMA